MAYDRDNIFAKILRGALPCETVFENEHVLAFRDIQPRKPVHVLVIPRGAWRNVGDFAAGASEAEIAGFIRAIGEVAQQLGLTGPGYRVIMNIGEHGGQEVDHLHAHILGGAPVGAMVV
ncbi:MAG: histidine triad nucleotide-binding protein [Pseudomonadota bacterium]